MPALQLALLLCLAGPAAPSDVAAGEKAWSEGRWDDASEAFARAYERTKDPTYLYARAQAEREAGRCERAIELYEEFLAHSESAEAKAAASEYIEACRAELAEAAPVEPPPPVAPPPPTVEPPPAVEPSPETDPEAPRRWYRDPWGGALVGVGLAASITGAALVGVAYRDASAAADAGDDRAFGEALDRAQRLERGGAIALSIGGALIVAGVVRWAIVGSAARRGRVAARGTALTFSFGL
jgi:tetratricopeptide (TPR) repeat protein